MGSENCCQTSNNTLLFWIKEVIYLGCGIVTGELGGCKSPTTLSSPQAPPWVMQAKKNQLATQLDNLIMIKLIH